ncbi:MAG: GNAT family N-acetyltransferase [Deltaproteobacteria bacterium]|nr:GNAT family N-acetyltransferase [Deltaproteobacteria bacterium]MBW2085923.1 GNAT family N-acetyltransferase [Deltaproteobacteria bacterium]
MDTVCLRTKFLDKTGSIFEVGLCDKSDFQYLLKMYDLFEPKRALQGLPPENSQIRREWVHGLLENGVNFLIWKDNEVVGHAALLPDLKKKDAEFMIFVSEPFRNRGLGTELTQAGRDKAIELGLELVWLTVESYNLRAIGLYKKFNFQFHGSGSWERTMILRL